jgi:hypothetical protein
VYCLEYNSLPNQINWKTIQLSVFLSASVAEPFLVIRRKDSHKFKSS